MPTSRVRFAIVLEAKSSGSNDARPYRSLARRSRLRPEMR